MANDPNKLSTAFAGTPLSKHGQKWSAFWEEKYTPWDRGGPSVALLDLLTTRPDLVPPPPSPAEQGQSDSDRPTALVPGCGKGHDALLLAGLGYDVLALDFSPTAIAEAKDNQKAVAARLGAGPEAAEGEVDAYTIRHPSGAEPGAVTWLSGDFFSDSWLAEWGREKAFDLIFDYTPLSLPGPPWGLTPEVYLALLSRPGEPLEFSSSTQAGDDTDIVIVPPFREDGLKRLELVKPARTHRAGMNEDGTVRDWIHVWGR
ncbi:thiocyanate methyltransferase 1 [Colletotrichum liriopes]|uniref:Thiocyanate methyltransferase 1 n=1 Tax=Colletotrichum liriopes TaxID=708192 RepID=A0AA37GQ37_9PEZI|nr:thiocyanate methyltransferase 1 [Colletotrichum liriopes]